MEKPGGPEAAGAQLLLGDAVTFTCFRISVLCFWATDASGLGAGLPCSAPESPPPSLGAPTGPARLSCAASRPAGRARERERGLLPRVCPAPRGEAEVLPRPEAHVPLRRGQCAWGERPPTRPHTQPASGQPKRATRGSGAPPAWSGRQLRLRTGVLVHAPHILAHPPAGPPAHGHSVSCRQSPRGWSWSARALVFTWGPWQSWSLSLSAPKCIGCSLSI